MADQTREQELGAARTRMLKFMQDHPEADLHAMVGVARNASADDIKKAYQKANRQLHPDNAAKDFVDSTPALKARMETMEAAAKAKADGLNAEQLAEFKQTNQRRFGTMPEAEVRGVYASKIVDEERTKLLEPYKGAIEQHKVANQARLANMSMAREMLLNPDMMTHYMPPEMRPGYKGPQAQTHTAPPRPASPPPAPQGASARQGAAGGGAVPPAPPPEPPQSQGHSGGGEPRHGANTELRPASRFGFGMKAVFGVLAAAGIGTVAALYMNGKEAQDKIDASPIKAHKYTSIDDTLNAKAPGQGAERLFVDRALGVTGLTGYAGKNRGRELEKVVGISPLQFSNLNMTLSSDIVRGDLTQQVKASGQAASMTFVQEANGHFVPVDPKADDKLKAHYEGLPKAKIDLSKENVTLTFEDPRNGKGPQSVSYPNAPQTQTYLIKDAQERQTAQAGIFKAAEAQFAARRAASEAAKAKPVAP